MVIETIRMKQEGFCCPTKKGPNVNIKGGTGLDLDECIAEWVIYSVLWFSVITLCNIIV